MDAVPVWGCGWWGRLVGGLGGWLSALRAHSTISFINRYSIPPPREKRGKKRRHALGDGGADEDGDDGEDDVGDEGDVVVRLVRPCQAQKAVCFLGGGWLILGGREGKGKGGGLRRSGQVSRSVYWWTGLGWVSPGGGLAHAGTATIHHDDTHPDMPAWLLSSSKKPEKLTTSPMRRRASAMSRTRLRSSQEQGCVLTRFPSCRSVGRFVCRRVGRLVVGVGWLFP